MADEPLSTKDLLLLAVGLYTLQPPLPQGASTGRDYYLKEDANKKYVLRETAWNPLWLLSPQYAWEGVRYRGWLLAHIAANLTGSTHDFSAIAEPLFVSLDLISKEFKPRMPNASEAIKQALVSKAGYERAVLTALTIGLSEQESAGQRVVVLGAGMRRRTRVWKEESQALQADVEFFLPFLPLTGGDKPKDSTLPNARSINAGIRLSRVNGSSIGTTGKDEAPLDLAAVRFNLRVPFTARVVDRYDAEQKRFYFRDAPEVPVEVPQPDFYKWEPGELITDFGWPAVSVEMLRLQGEGSEPAQWEPFKDWKKFVEKFCKTTEGSELLNAPVGPLLLETVSDSSGLKDILKSHRGEIKKDFEETQKELEAAAQLLKGIFENKIPKPGDEPDSQEPSSSMRRLGGLLESLGLLSGKSGAEVKYSLAKLDGLSVWDVINRLLEELDGFPLYVSGIDPKEPDAMRMAFSLASQTAIDAPRKQYFGLAGLAYNIPIKTTPEKKEQDEAEEDPVLVLGQNYFTDEENIVEDDWVLVPEERAEDDWIVVPTEEKKEEAKPEEKKEVEKQKSGVDLRLQLGKWFSGETLDDNWLRRLLPAAGTKESPWKRRVPLPGIRLFPLQRTLAENNSESKFSLALRGDLLSLGVDIRGRTEQGLTFLHLDEGPLTYFGLGAVEVRIALMFAAGRVVFGIGVKLKDMRLSFGEREQTEEEKEQEKQEKAEKKKAATDEIIAGLKELLSEDDWTVTPAPDPAKEKKPKTRLGAKKKDKFSISIGYLSPVTDKSPGTLDVQLYDEKGVRGKMVWIPIEKRSGSLYVKDIGISLKGLENFEPGRKLAEGAQLDIALTGGLRWPAFELGFIGARIGFPLKAQGWFDFGLEGLDISFKAGPVVVSGSFLKSGLEFGGSLTVELPKFSIAAIGFYGAIVLFEMEPEEDVLRALLRREVHEKLRRALAEKKITPEGDKPVVPIFINNWQIRATDGQSYTLLKDGDKLHLLSQDKAFFFYGMMSAGSSGGPQFGPIQLNAVALGFGYNRRLIVPPIEEIAEFPLVKMVMGEGGYQEEDESGNFLSQVSKAVEPASLLKDMGDALEAEAGHNFACLGARFTIARVLDCFALAVVQWSKEDFELYLLGLARFKQPSDPSAKPICYVEMQLLVSFKPSEGSFKLQALLTSNSWVLNKDCKLTGGFAVFVWFGGPHKGDVVVTLGGYHPRFKRPDHYPIVPRLGLNWQVSPELSIKGGVYLAFTPSCGMAGARLEAVYRSNRVTVWFTAYWDAIVNWSPFHFELEIGVSLRVEAALLLFTLKVTVSATLKLWGPPVGGYARLEVSVITLELPFGARREEARPRPIEKWERFSQSFLSPSEADKGTHGPAPWLPPITTPQLNFGRSNFAGLPDAAKRQEASKQNDGAWRVRPDQLELGAASVVPVTTLNVGRVKTNSPPAGVQERSPSGRALLVSEPVELVDEGLQVKTYDRPLGVHPMGKTLESVLNVTIVRDEVSETTPWDMSGWLVETETTSLPASLWNASKPNPNGPAEPSADLVPDCITGIKRLRPPIGQRGASTSFTEMTWHQLEPSIVPRTGARQEVPTETRPRDVQTAAATKQSRHETVAEALAAIGFDLAWRPAQGPIRFRDLQAEPLSGAVATGGAR